MEELKFWGQFGVTAVLLVGVLVWFAKSHLPTMLAREDTIRLDHDKDMERWWSRKDDEATKRGAEFSHALTRMLDDSKLHHANLDSKITNMQLGVDNVSKRLGDIEPKVTELHYDWKRKQGVRNDER